MRVVLFSLSILAGAVLIAAALLMPAHLRAVDPQVVARRGAAGQSLVEVAAEAASRNPAVAKVILIAAESLNLAGTEKVVENLRLGAQERSGTRTVLEQLEAQEAGRVQVMETPVVTALRKSANRERLQGSFGSTEAKRVLITRDLTNTVFFAPAKSAAGAPMEIAILTTAFLMEQRAFPSTLPLHDEVLRLTASTNMPPLEEFYLSMFALAKRFSSEQIIAFVEHIPTDEALHTLTRAMQEQPEAAALLYSTVVLSRDGGAVARYLQRFPTTAVDDLRFALTTGIAGMKELLGRQLPIYRSGFYNALEEDRRVQFLFRPLLALSASAPALALLLKFTLILAGAFLLAYALRFRSRAEENSYVYIPRFSMVRRAAFAVVFLLLTILLGEPYLAQGETKPAWQPRWSFSVLGAAAVPPPPAKPQSSSTMVDTHTLLAILTFLVLQTTIYVVCLAKLAEIRKQPVSNATKLKLLDNEDNLFDGGLYCGLFGTAGSLILLTIGAIKPSLVSAYSSTLFGILFVALLKIVHVRPLKRRLLLESAESRSA